MTALALVEVEVLRCIHEDDPEEYDEPHHDEGAVGEEARGESKVGDKELGDSGGGAIREADDRLVVTEL